MPPAAQAPAGDAGAQKGIRVIARVRPFLPTEHPPERPCIYVEGGAVFAADPHPERAGYGVVQPTSRHVFDTALGPEATQEDVYAALKGEVYNVMCGVPMLLLAYGVTSAGKSHTLFGYGEDSGAFGRAVTDIFSLAAQAGMEARFRVSAVQIYKKTVTDLLNNNAELKIYSTSPDSLPYRTWTPVHSAQECVRVAKEALARREVSSTKLNSTSSRSHCIFTLAVDTRVSGPGGAEATASTALCLVDLAGSEPYNAGDSRALEEEACFIRTSLLALSRVVTALRDIEKDRRALANVRESPLTMALKPFLVPTSFREMPANIAIILNLHGNPEGFSANRDTLSIGLVAKAVKSYPKTPSRLGMLSEEAGALVRQSALRSASGVRSTIGRSGVLRSGTPKRSGLSAVSGSTRSLRGSKHITVEEDELWQELNDYSGAAPGAMRKSRARPNGADGADGADGVDLAVGDFDAERLEAAGVDPGAFFVPPEAISPYNVLAAPAGEFVLIPTTDWKNILGEFERLAKALSDAAREAEEDVIAARRETVAELTQLMEFNVAKEREALVSEIVERDKYIQRLTAECAGLSKLLDEARMELMSYRARGVAGLTFVQG